MTKKPDFFHCLSAEDFTLERIIELGLDQFAEQISDVSGAASKELSIEQVSLSYLVSLKQTAFCFVVDGRSASWGQ